MPIKTAYQILEDSIITYQGKAVGTAAACDARPAAVNYHECFIRDFVPSALVFLMDGRTEIVRNFIITVMQLRDQQTVLEGHKRSLGLMPASFKVIEEGGEEHLVADFGERAIGRVIAVDSAMWWMFLLRAYVIATGDWDFAKSIEVQECINHILDLYLRERFESSPTLLVPDGSFMIDRRMGVYGYPLEIQALYYGMLQTAEELLSRTNGSESLIGNLQVLIQALRSYVRTHYWIDRDRLNQIHRYEGEEFGLDVANVLNVYPESIPEWMDGWLDSRSGYLVGNQGPGRVDFRVFTQGNLLAILFGLATREESQGIMNLFASRWDELIGEMPVKIMYPAVLAKEWMYMTGSDPKNVPWSYHNGGSWPVLIWPFVAASMRTGRIELAERALELITERLRKDNWPEYYDGKHGGLIGRRANFHQVWSATGLIIAHQVYEDSESQVLFDSFTFSNPVKDRNLHRL